MFPYDRTTVEPLVAELERARARLDAKGPLIRSWEGRLRREIEAEAIAASTSMEGIPVTADDVRRVLAQDKPRQLSDADARLVSGYRDAMEYVLRRADDPAFQWNTELLIGLHDRVMGGRFGEGAGRLRRVDRYLVERGTGEEVFSPPPWQDVPTLVDRAFARMRDRPDHPAVDAAWVHVTLAAIHPFEDGNGRTSRILASLAMYRGGFARSQFTSLEEWWGRHLAEYYGAFRSLGPTFDENIDVTEFIRSQVSAQLAQVSELDDRERLQRHLWVAMENLCRDERLPERMANALWDAFLGRDISAGYYRELADVSPATATNDLTTLTAAGLLRAHGERRGRRYALGPELNSLVIEQLGLEIRALESDVSRAVLGQLALRVLGRPLDTPTSSPPMPQPPTMGTRPNASGRARIDSVAATPSRQGRPRGRRRR